MTKTLETWLLLVLLHPGIFGRLFSMLTSAKSRSSECTWYFYHLFCDHAILESRSLGRVVPETRLRREFIFWNMNSEIPPLSTNCYEQNSRFFLYGYNRMYWSCFSSDSKILKTGNHVCNRFIHSANYSSTSRELGLGLAIGVRAVSVTGTVRGRGTVQLSGRFALCSAHYRSPEDASVKGNNGLILNLECFSYAVYA